MGRRECTDKLHACQYKRPVKNKMQSEILQRLLRFATFLCMRYAAVDFVVRNAEASEYELASRLDRLTHEDPLWSPRDFKAAQYTLCAVLPGQEGHGDEFVGYCVITSSGKQMTVHRVGVHPEWQRCGIGSALVSIARRDIGNCNTVWVDMPNSAPHRSFWNGLGFRDSGIVSGTWVRRY